MVNAKTLPDQQKKHIYHQMEEKKQGGSRRIRSVKGQQNCFFFSFLGLLQLYIQLLPRTVIRGRETEQMKRKIERRKTATLGLSLI